VTESHENEYDDALVGMLELIWGKGFLAPGGAENVRQIVAGLDLRDKLVLDIGSGIGGVDLILAGELGARVVGLEIEAPLVERARRYAAEAGLDERIEFRHVAPGPLPLEDAQVDVVFSNGVFIHIDDKAAMFREVRRVLKPGGVLSAYDWLRGPDEYNDDMRYWFRMEGLTYSMGTLEGYRGLLEAAGFTAVETVDNSSWYCRHCKLEYERMRGALYDTIGHKLGEAARAHFIENWRAMVVVLDQGQLRTGRFRAAKPGRDLTAS